MRGLSPDTVIVKPNLIRLVRRADSTYWQAHYKLDKLGKWMRKGTGTADLEKAKEFANESMAQKIGSTAQTLKSTVTRHFSTKTRSVSKITPSDFAAALLSSDSMSF
jgi:hypothetical protein